MGAKLNWGLSPWVVAETLKIDKPHWNLTLTPGENRRVKKRWKCDILKEHLLEAYELWLPPLTQKSNFEKKELLVTNYCPRYYRADIKLKSDIIIIKRKEKLFMRIFINFICLIEITKICFNLLWTNKTCFYFSFIGRGMFFVNKWKLPPCPWTMPLPRGKKVFWGKMRILKYNVWWLWICMSHIWAASRLMILSPKFF